MQRIIDVEERNLSYALSEIEKMASSYYGRDKTSIKSISHAYNSDEKMYTVVAVVENEL